MFAPDLSGFGTSVSGRWFSPAIAKPPQYLSALESLRPNASGPGCFCFSRSSGRAWPSPTLADGCHAATDTAGIVMECLHTLEAYVLARVDPSHIGCSLKSACRPCNGWCSLRLWPRRWSPVLRYVLNHECRKLQCSFNVNPHYYENQKHLDSWPAIACNACGRHTRCRCAVP